MNDVLGVIPARFASTRLPGKPLADIAGKPMIQWVYEKTASALPHVVVATDDQRVLEAVRGFGGNAVMTRADHANGTLRCLEALEQWQITSGKTYRAVVNVQGDEPLMDPQQIATLVQALEGVSFATLAMPVINPEDLTNNSEVFVVFDKHMRALYFSRAVIPVVRGVDRSAWMQHTTFYKHIGLYAYTPEALKQFTQLPPSALETTESLEQNRWLEAGEFIRVGITHHDSIPVDTPEDLERVRNLMRKHTP
jgi:3-deoxy-manno-octulosonate cytidylyltransferase (CMP-KDO synthetase)